MSTITKEQLIEDLKASTQNTSGMFEISEGAICALMSMLTSTAPQLPQPAPEEIAMQNFRSAMEGIGHIRRTLEETFGGLHGTHCEPDVLVECKEICDAIYEAYRKTAQVTPDGWQLVPIDPTKDMLRAGQSVVGFWLNTVHCYSKMLAAAPEAPQQEVK